MADWSGFHRHDRDERIRRVSTHGHFTPQDEAALDGGLDLDAAEGLIENVIGRFVVPLGVAVGFVIDGQETVVPMAVEESSVVAAASHGAKIAAAGGGFRTHVDPSITIGQIEVRDIVDFHAAERRVALAKDRWIRFLNDRIPRMVARGGGVREIVVRQVPGRRAVVHLHVDCRDAMGANLVNELCEALAPELTETLQGSPGLRILSNLATNRLARATFSTPVKAVGGMAVAEGILSANEFAMADPYRAATHNKGIMNGIDPVALATGNDWRAIEAGAHAFAATSGRYAPLTAYRLDGEFLTGEIRLPISVGTVGGVTALHPTARACMKILGNPDARRLAGIMAAVGLAQNLSALKALSTEGIQRGHMSLHASNIAMQAGLKGKEARRVADAMTETGRVSVAEAKRLSKE